MSFILFIFFTTGCANYQRKIEENTRLYQSGKYEDASKKFAQQSKKKQRGNDALLFRLEHSAALRMANHLDDADEVLLEADGMIRHFEETGPNVRLGQETVAAFSNPANIRYEGWMTDRIMVSTYLGVDNMLRGDWDAARVHLNKAYQRQQDAVEKNKKKLEKEQAEYRQDRRVNDALSSPTTQNQLSSMYQNLKTLKPLADYVNPFTSYMRGLFFLWCGEDSADWEMGRKALEQAYVMSGKNSYIGKDYLLAEKIASGENPNTNLTYVIFENAQGPYLKEFKCNLPLPIDRGIYSLTMAFPIFQTRNFQNSLRVKTANESANTEVICSMDDVFGADFQSELPKITARIIATVLIRQVESIAVNQALRQSGGEAQLLGSLALFIAHACINIADVRSWTLLPQDFQVCRVDTPSDGKLAISETHGAQRLDVSLPSTKGINLVYIKSARPGKPMIVWIKQISTGSAK